MNIPEFALVALLLELTPGPNMAYLAVLTLERGRAAGLVALAGVALGLGAHAVLAAFGMGELLTTFPVLYEILRWTGIAYLLYLARTGWRAETAPEHLDFGATAIPLFRRGLFSNLFNPKSVIFFVSVLPRFLDQGPAASLPLQMAILGAIYVGIATAVHTAIVLMAARLRPYLVQGARRDLVRRTLSLLLVLVAAWLAWTTAR